MTTVTLKYNEKNDIARKAMEFILSLGVFQTTEQVSPAKKKTLKAIEDARTKHNVTTCATFDDYLKAVSK